MSESSGVSVAPPGPRGYPLLGVFPSARKDPLGFFLESARTHGDVVALPFGMRRLYLLSHPDHIKYVLQEHDGLFQKGPAAARIKPLFGESLTTVDGDDWSRRRRLLRPAFQPQRLVAAVPTIAAMAEEMLGRWRSPLEHGRPLDVFAEMIGVTRAIILRILFGDVSEVDAWTVGQAFTTTAERVNRELWSPLGWLFRLLPSSARYERAERCLDEFMTRRIDEARRRGPGRDLLSTMLAARDEETDGRFDDAALADELKALFVAGHTTTASGLAWVWYVLSQNSRARRRLQNEVRAVLGTRPPTADDLPALDYTRTVIEETLRLYPPTWVTARTTSRAVDIGAYHIPANVIVPAEPVRHAPRPAFLGGSRSVRSGPVLSRPRNATALCVFPVRRGTARVHRKPARADRDADHRRDGGSALRAHAGARVARRPSSRHRARAVPRREGDPPPGGAGDRLVSGSNQSDAIRRARSGYSGRTSATSSLRSLSASGTCFRKYFLPFTSDRKP